MAGWEAGMGMMDRRKQIIKKEQERHFVCGELSWKNHLSAADAALEAQKIPIISTGVKG